MAWQQFKQTDREDLIEYLSKKEWGHVGFSSRFRRAKEISPPRTIYLRRNTSGEGIREALLCTRDGLIIPALAAASPSFRSDLSGVLNGEKQKQRPNTVMGLRNQVEAVEKNIGLTPHASVTYHVMTRTTQPGVVPPCDGIACKRAKPRDTGMLYPLQKGYEIEEVLLDPGLFNASSCYLRLQKNLRIEPVICAMKDGKAVSKAGTNAIGYTFAQIGGVYTMERNRNQGIAEYVLSVLLTKIFETRKGASLFVKKNNSAAIKLYAKLGFSVTDEFKITYYR
jgi:uncharacterized protein